uniref:C2H2-type domain-containing protein n=1 Tax=Leptobrachium leishanense TaxID=445787 RepID=A0A8C5M928_9ANUR
MSSEKQPFNSRNVFCVSSPLDESVDRPEADGFSTVAPEDGEMADNQTVKPVTVNKQRKRKSKPVRHKGSLYEERELMESDIYRHMEHPEYLSTPIQDESDLSIIENHRDVYSPTDHAQGCDPTPISEDSISCDEGIHEHTSYGSEYISVHIKEEESSSCEEKNLSDSDIYTSVEQTQTETTSGCVKEESASRSERTLAYRDLYYPPEEHGEAAYASTSQEKTGSYEETNSTNPQIQRSSRHLLMKKKADSKSRLAQSLELINQQRQAIDSMFDSFQTHDASDTTSDLVTHHDAKKTSCPECGKTFSSKANLLSHQCLHQKPRFVRRNRTCQGENSLSCSCGKCFHKLKYFRRHQMVHSGEKPFPCSQCGKSFKLKATLKSHERIHTGEKPFSCSECGKCFRQRSGRNTHQKIHTGEKPFSCFECGKCFIEKPRLLAHMRIHTGEKPFSCTECGRCFTNYSNLLAHRKIHNGDKPFPCPECGKCFSKKVYLNAHQIQGCSNASDANY